MLCCKRRKLISFTVMGNMIIVHYSGVHTAAVAGAPVSC